MTSIIYVTSYLERINDESSASAPEASSASRQTSEGFVFPFTLDMARENDTYILSIPLEHHPSSAIKSYVFPLESSLPSGAGLAGVGSVLRSLCRILMLIDMDPSEAGFEFDFHL